MNTKIDYINIKGLEQEPSEFTNSNRWYTIANKQNEFTNIIENTTKQKEYNLIKGKINYLELKLVGTRSEKDFQKITIEIKRLEHILARIKYDITS